MMHIFRKWLSVFPACMILLLAHGSIAAGEEVLKPDDEVRLMVYGEESLSGIHRIDSTGSINLPLVGKIRLEGLTISQAQSLIHDRFSDGFLVDPSLALEIARYRPFYILGEVRSPGKYDYSAGMTVLQAVALAGGFTYRADEKTAEILKSGSRESQEFPVSALIAPGDVITIDERFF